MSFISLLQPSHLVSDLSNKWHVKWLVTVCTFPSSPPPPNSELSQCDKISIPKPSPRTVKLLFSPFSHKSQIDTGNFFFLCLQCNWKICFYLEAIQKSSLFLEYEIAEDFSKKVSSINYVIATKGFYLWQSPWGFERRPGLRFLEIEKPKSFERIAKFPAQKLWAKDEFTSQRMLFHRLHWREISLYHNIYYKCHRYDHLVSIS